VSRRSKDSFRDLYSSWVLIKQGGKYQLNDLRWTLLLVGEVADVSGVRQCDSRHWTLEPASASAEAARVISYGDFIKTQSSTSPTTPISTRPAPIDSSQQSGLCVCKFIYISIRVGELELLNFSGTPSQPGQRPMPGASRPKKCFLRGIFVNS